MARKIPHLFYTGDVNIEHGGIFYNLDNFRTNGYADAVRVAPGSDAGLADNEFWIEHITVNIPRDESIFKSALDCCGYTLEDLGPKNRAQYWHMLFDALIAYGYYDQDASYSLRIGKKDPYAREYMPEENLKQVRAGSSLRRIAIEHAREHIG